MTNWVIVNMSTNKTPSQRFKEKVRFGPMDQCWEWVGSKMRLGYGMFSVNGKNRLAHRVAWEMVAGEIPPGQCVLHRCDNPGCVNPAHLFLGTQQDNIRDRDQKGRQRGPLGEKQHLSKLDESGVRHIRRVHRYGIATHRQLAETYGVSDSTITDIIQRRTWRHVA